MVLGVGLGLQDGWGAQRPVGVKLEQGLRVTQATPLADTFRPGDQAGNRPGGA